MTWKYSVHVRCGCRGPDGKQLGQSCPQLWRKDGSWNNRHGSAGFVGRVPTSEGTKQLKKFGYPSRKAAQDAAEHVGKLLDLAQNRTDGERIGDMLRAVRQGAPLPTVEDVQRRLGLGLDPAQEGLTVAEWLDTGWRPSAGPSARAPAAATRCTSAPGSSRSSATCRWSG